MLTKDEQKLIAERNQHVKALRQKWYEVCHYLELALKYQKKSRNYLESSLKLSKEYEQAIKELTSTYNEENIFKTGLSDLLSTYDLYEKMTSEESKSRNCDRSSVACASRAYQSWSKISLEEYLTIPDATKALYDDTEAAMNDILGTVLNK